MRTVKMSKLEEALLDLIGEEKLQKIQSAVVGIGGSGGLGSNCAFNLARVGFRNFYIYDFDIIEPSNLNRQFFFEDQIGRPKVEALRENLQRINPNISVEAQQVRITAENIQKLFTPCHVVVEAFDTVESKMLIVESFMQSDKLLVSASGLAGWGESDKLGIRKITDTFYMVGDSVTGVSKENPPMSPRVNVAAAMEADTVLDWVLAK